VAIDCDTYVVGGAVACPAATPAWLSGCQAARRPGGSRPCGGGEGGAGQGRNLSPLGMSGGKFPYNPELGGLDAQFRESFGSGESSFSKSGCSEVDG